MKCSGTFRSLRGIDGASIPLDHDLDSGFVPSMRNPSLDDRVRRTGIDQGLREDAVDQHSNEKEVVARAGEPAGPTGQTGRGRETGPSRPSGWVRVRVRGRVRVRVRGTRPAGLERVRATRPSVRVRVGVRIRMRVRVWGTRVGRPLPHRQTGTPHRCEEQKNDTTNSAKCISVSDNALSVF